MNAPLKVLLTLDSRDIETWLYQLIDNIIEDGHCKLYIAIKASSSSELEQPLSQVNRTVWQLYRKFVMRNILTPSHSEKKHVESFADKVTVIELDTQLGNPLQDLDLDVALITDKNDYNEHIATRHGTWWLFNDFDLNRQFPIKGYREVMHNEPVSKCYIAKLSHGSSYLSIIARSTSPVNPLSIEDTVRASYWNFPTLVRAKLRQLCILEPEICLEELEQISFPQTVGAKLAPYKKLNIFNQIYFLSSSLAKKARRLYQNHKLYEQWGLLLGNAEQTVEDLADNIAEMKPIFPDNGDDWADPHMIEVDGTLYLFIEELVKPEDKVNHSSKGTIAFCTIDELGNLSPTECVLDTGYHLSFPNIFEHEGAYYMIPESSESKRIELYKAYDFPRDWRLEKVLMDDIVAVDTTVLYRDQKWWMFTNISESEIPLYNNHLYIYHCNDLLKDDWTPHPLNPVLSDCQTARLAGRVFEQGDKLIRPSQDCSTRYGLAVNFNEIEVLDEQHYKEKLLSKTLPQSGSGFLAHHSYAKAGKFIMIDAIQQRQLSR